MSGYVRTALTVSVVVVTVVLVVIVVAMVVATAKLICRWPPRPNHHAASEIPLPQDPYVADWAAWEIELRQKEER